VKGSPQYLVRGEPGEFNARWRLYIHEDFEEKLKEILDEQRIRLPRLGFALWVHAYMGIRRTKCNISEVKRKR